ncbi:MAG: reverse transcriptase-like protein [Nitrososphaeria archaeon]|nr:reverse transcriptase-like protein [Nitrososphaeria archaeon]NIN52244.1 reverse transcriptase-like protein [Nitrososphaeria archaeon]NIQ32700.1 reverse transcriptase-like protein [Nitrososphaeria archaeon]
MKVFTTRSQTWGRWESLGYDRVLLYTDGASRGNPGPSATGFILCDEEGHTLRQGAEFIGESTNNRAEYRALVKGLEAVLSLTNRCVQCFLDSELLVNQLTEKYAVRNPELKKLFRTVKKLEAGFKSITYTHIPRTHKIIMEVDRLVALILDKELGRRSEDSQ